METSLIPVTNNGIPHFRFPNLSGIPGLRHGIFTRKGGVSRGPYESLNVGRGVGDNPANVKQNRRLISECLDAERLIFIHQVHGASVVTIDRDHDPDIPVEGDALMTNQPGSFLAIQVADCQPVLLFDPVRRVIAAVHSGWRGSTQHVIEQTVGVMAETYGCRPETMLAGIGPSLGPCCGEFVNYRDELPESFWKYRDDANRFDFWAISRDQLLAGGLRKENIHISRLCTRCRQDLFFSYRRENTTGRFTAVIGLM